MNNIFVQTLTLENYRNFQNLEIKTENKPIILIGENGSGKTNILEAISLFFPGRGLRSARLTDICKRGADECQAKMLLQSKLGLAEISTYFKLDSKKRVTQFNGSKIQNNELNHFIKMIWLTPQMEGIFSTGVTEKRKFLDRIVYNFINSHASIVNQYEHYMYERSKALEANYVDTKWLKIIEAKMAELSIEIANNRLKILDSLQTAINNLDNYFPKALLSTDGIIEQKILSGENNVNSFIMDQLYVMRDRDKISRRTNFGIHKSDFIVIHKEKNTLAKFCSTGEQKAMLTTVILAQVHYSLKSNLDKPILLLDEIFVHLDNKRKEYLIEFFLALNLQLWITATDLNGIEKLALDSQLISL